MQAIAERAQGTWDKFRKERDFHRMHHKRVVQVRDVPCEKRNTQCLVRVGFGGYSRQQTQRVHIVIPRVWKGRVFS